ncbi:MbtH family protein [Rhizohabitans arisaemae]|uniref:MbtH family protein n=1 Tax=Rhizohabitans arisaemae TaxID=2720610 RepID=UPI0024B13FE0|nr:MbtH family NRPS accessory protein [Rhizohabitans arisaemae]
MTTDDDIRRHVVVINDEEQYSVWPEGREIPPGWYPRGEYVGKKECLDLIEEAWTDMRPRGLREGSR